MGLLWDIKNALIIERLWKTRGRYKNSGSSGSEPGGCAMLIALVIVIIMGWWGVQWCCSKVSYWDTVYVRDGFRTYKYQDFHVKDKYDVDKVEYPSDEFAKVMVPIFNIKTGEEKEVEVMLPLIELDVNTISTENLDGVKKIIAYEQPDINRGEDFLKPQNVILFDSKEYKAALEKGKKAYKSNNPENFKNWSFEKPKIK